MLCVLPWAVTNATTSQTHCCRSNSSVSFIQDMNERLYIGWLIGYFFTYFFHNVVNEKQSVPHQRSPCMNACVCIIRGKKIHMQSMSWCQQEVKDDSKADYLNQHVKQLKVMLMPSDHFLDESFSVAVFSRQPWGGQWRLHVLIFMLIFPLSFWLVMKKGEKRFYCKLEG